MRLLSTLRAFQALAPQHVSFSLSGLTLPRTRTSADLLKC
jgi:hypothetical protein